MTTTGESTWTGKLEIDLRSGYGWSVATVDVAVRLDTVGFFVGGRNMGVIERGAFQRWLHHSELALYFDDIGFVLMDAQLCVTIKGSAPYPLSTEMVSQLFTLV